MKKRNVKGNILFSDTFNIKYVISVSDLPEGEPKMVMEKQRYAVGDILRGNCTSPPSNPPTNLTWFVNGKKVNHNLQQPYKIIFSVPS